MCAVRALEGGLEHIDVITCYVRGFEMHAGTRKPEAGARGNIALCDN